MLHDHAEKYTLEQRKAHDRARVELPNVGLGTMRTSGTYIGALLQLEDDEHYAVSILVDAAKTIGITLEQITEAWNDSMCPKCGMAQSLHTIGGRCP
jgi:hypothetical protein